MKKTRDEIKDLRQFGMVLAGILMVFSLIHFLKGRVLMFRYFLSFGVISFALALIVPKALRGIYAVFIKVAHAIGWFNTRAILILIYFLLVTPIAVIARVFGKDPLSRKIDKKETTYWIKRPDPKVIRERLEKQF